MSTTPAPSAARAHSTTPAAAAAAAAAPQAQPHATTPRLSMEQVAFYQREGYLLPQIPILPEAEFTQLKTVFERLLLTWTAGGGRPEAMDVPHFYYPELLPFVMHPRVLDLVEPLIGPDIALFSSHFICKPAGDGKRVPWHEDSAYWQKVLSPMEVVTVWLAIDESRLENGCMEVIPGSHVNGYSEYEAVDGTHHVFDSEIRKGQFDPTTSMPCILKPNQASLHHAKTIHGSGPNPSAKRRCGYTMRFISTHSRWDAGPVNPKAPNLHQLYLARGVDHAGNTYGDPTKPNQPWVDHYGMFCPKGH